MDARPVVALVTVPSRELGERMADALVEGNLAACVNVVGPIRSVYTWEGKTRHNEEMLLIAKTTLGVFEGEFMAAVRSMHPYEVPEIIALPIVGGSDAYLQWVGSVTKG